MMDDNGYGPGDGGPNLEEQLAQMRYKYATLQEQLIQLQTEAEENDERAERDRLEKDRQITSLMGKVQRLEKEKGRLEEKLDLGEQYRRDLETTQAVLRNKEVELERALKELKDWRTREKAASFSRDRHGSISRGKSSSFTSPDKDKDRDKSSDGLDVSYASGRSASISLTRARFTKRASHPPPNGKAPAFSPGGSNQHNTSIEDLAARAVKPAPAVDNKLLSQKEMEIQHLRDRLDEERERMLELVREMDALRAHQEEEAYDEPLNQSLASELAGMSLADELGGLTGGGGVGVGVGVGGGASSMSGSQPSMGPLTESPVAGSPGPAAAAANGHTVSISTADHTATPSANGRGSPGDLITDVHAQFQLLDAVHKEIAEELSEQQQHQDHPAWQDSLQEENESLRQQLKESQDYNKELQRQADDSRKRKRELLDECIQHDNQVVNLYTEINHLKRQLEDAERQIAKLQRIEARRVEQARAAEQQQQQWGQQQLPPPMLHRGSSMSLPSRQLPQPPSASAPLPQQQQQPGSSFAPPKPAMVPSPGFGAAAAANSAAAVAAPPPTSGPRAMGSFSQQANPYGLASSRQGSFSQQPPYMAAAQQPPQMQQQQQEPQQQRQRCHPPRVGVVRPPPLPLL
eukprot:m.193021 g.193021  ORF g.193021 m.193021 type:complete len:634 (-) comp17592_c0_seq9:5166-7067(-)